MNRVKLRLAVSVGSAALLATNAMAQETVTYTYDSLGRLKSSAVAGGPNGGTTIGTCFDAAGNRTQYGVATSGTAACYTQSTPTPTPTPTPTNQPPVAVADTGSVQCNQTKTLNLLANDYDPDGNVPLSLVSINNTTGVVSATIASSGTSASVLSAVPGPIRCTMSCKIA